MNKNIQIVRGVCIFAVILLHTCKNVFPNIFFKPLFTFPVCVFFFLSGYLTREIKDVNSFYKKRLSKVLLPYFFWSIVYSLLNKITIVHLVYNLLTAESAPHLYYLVVYSEFVLITPILLKISNSRTRYFPLFLQPITIVLFKYIPILLSINLPSFMVSENCFLWVACYYFGIIMTHTNYDRNELYVAGCISILLQEAEVYFWYELNIMELASTQIRITTMITNIIICFIVTKFIASKQRENIFSHIGDNSFGIYCCHMAFIMVLNKLGFNRLHFFIYAVIVLILSFGFTSILSSRLNENIKKIIGFV